MRNNFTQKTRELFIDVPCCICGGFQANALHHIMGRISNSPYNAAPIHNQRCHLNKDGKMGRGDLNRKDRRLLLLERTAFYLNIIQAYQPTRKDEEFMDYVISKYYEEAADIYYPFE